MNFYSQTFLKQHVSDLLDFYEPRICDPSGGYHQNYYDNGEVFDSSHKHLVSSTRLVINFATGWQLFGKQPYKDIALHGLSYLESVHWQEQGETYIWQIQQDGSIDRTQQAYGYAFVILCYARALQYAVIQDTHKLYQSFDLLNQRFWQDTHELYADELSEDGVLSDYRGQNANMHICEALIAAYQATKDRMFLDRAILVASNITERQAGLTGGFIWEHFTKDFAIDWDYNRDDPKNLYRPWGFQLGHQTEWSKLLIQLHRLTGHPGLLERAGQLFDKSFPLSWDDKNGGLIYGFDDKHQWCDTDKYFWVQAESMAAAAMLYQYTHDKKYLQYYEQLWDYCWEHFIDHEFGGWYRLLDRENNRYSDVKSAAGAKSDYHTIGACMDVLTGFKA